MGHPRYSADEIVKRGKELYERDIRSKVEEGNKGKILMIDIETGEYEIDDNPLDAAERARARHPDAALFAMRIGYPTMGRLGVRSWAANS
jgi:hypothetical protein